MSSKSQREYTKDFVGLVIEYPYLDVMPMVESGVDGGDDFAWWKASISESYIDEYYDDDDGCIYIRSKQFDEVVEKYIDNNYEEEDFWKMKDNEIWNKAVKEVEKYKWTQVIMLSIGTP